MRAVASKRRTERFHIILIVESDAFCKNDEAMPEGARLFSQFDGLIEPLVIDS